MKIPKSFKLAGHTITVRYDPKLLHNDDCLGLANYRDLEIVLQPSTKTRTIPRSQLEQTFIHEKIHFILWVMSNDSRKDEVFVDLMAQFLQQASTTESVKGF